MNTQSQNENLYTVARYSRKIWIYTQSQNVVCERFLWLLSFQTSIPLWWPFLICQQNYTEVLIGFAKVVLPVYNYIAQLKIWNVLNLDAWTVSWTKFFDQYISCCIVIWVFVHSFNFIWTLSAVVKVVLAIPI